jgi:polysaccharide export outer membrane protein
MQRLVRRRDELPSRAVVGLQLFAYDECWRYLLSVLKSFEVGLKCHKIAEPGLGFHGKQGRAMRRGRRTVSSPLLGRGLLALSLAALLGAGCAATPQHQSLAPANTTPSPMVTQVNSALVAATLQTPSAAADYRLGAEDLLEITLFNVPDSGTGVISRRAEVRVTQGEVITLPLLGDIPVVGLTTSALEQALRQRYDEYLYNPQVGVQVKEYRSQRISVVGAVKNAGVFQLTGPKTLVDLLAMAGGISERAGKQVHIYRQRGEGRETYVVDLLALASSPGLVNMPVQPGDVINVPEVGNFFVDGAIGKPGSYPLTQPYTLTQALAVAGGVNTDLSDESNVAIIRRRDSVEVNRISANLKEILAGRASDPQIEPNDMIVMPINGAKWFLKRFIGGIGLPGIPGIPY